MAIQFTCSCGKQMQAKEDFAGRKMKCPNCQQLLTIPGVFPSSLPDAAAPQGAVTEEPQTHDVTIPAQAQAEPAIQPPVTNFDNAPPMVRPAPKPRENPVQKPDQTMSQTITPWAAHDKMQVGKMNEMAGSGFGKWGICLLVVLLLVGVGVAGWMFAPNVKKIADELNATRWENVSHLEAIPPDGQMFLSVQPSSIWDGPIVKEIRNTVPLMDGTIETAKFFHPALDPKAVKRVSLFIPANAKIDKDTFPAIAVLETHDPVNPKEFVEAIPATQTVKIKKQVIYLLPDVDNVKNIGLCFLSDTMLLAGDTDNLKQYLQTPPDPNKTGALSATIEQTKSNQFVLHLPKKLLTSLPKDGFFPVDDEEAKTLAELVKNIGTVEEIHLLVDAADDFRITLSVTFDEAAKAEEIKTLFQELLEDSKKELQTSHETLSAVKQQRSIHLGDNITYLFSTVSQQGNAFPLVATLGTSQIRPDLRTLLSAQVRYEQAWQQSIGKMEGLYSQTKLSVTDKTLRLNTELKLSWVQDFLGDVENRKQLVDQRLADIERINQLSTALLDYHDVKSHFPIVKRKKGLSWRVEILPYIGKTDLYNEFHLDEPWDSEHNKSLLAKMPEEFKLIGVESKPGHTFYRLFVGGGALFKEDEAVSKSDVKDGLSDTLMIVEAGQSVPWTKPDELAFGKNNPLPWLGGHYPDGFLASFAARRSGQVLPYFLSAANLRTLISRSGGDKVNWTEINSLSRQRLPLELGQ